ncbi:MAG TPA: twin-arginine translocase subunit TatC [Actinomycetales bacterium]|nr:twin-arginine translocase subunit TatC [Actinomycetales bacterium]
MRLVEHLAEARRRILLVVAGFAVGAVAGWFLFDPLLSAMAAPLEQVRESGRSAELNFTTVLSGFDMRMRMALFLSGLVTAPWWLYQAWAFVAPGLKRTEKKYVVGFMSAALPLFIGGAALGWLLLPHAVRVFLSFTPTEGVNLIDATTYLTFTMRLVTAFGIAFLFPVVMVVLNLIGVVRSRTYLKGWRWAVVGVFTFAALANPLPDPWSMIVLGAIMVSLYFAAVGIAYLNDRRVERRRAKLLEGGAPA